MQASCCFWVSEWLYLLEAALKRARRRRCLHECGSLGFTQRRRNCLLPRNTNHTQSPHRPLLRVVSRHAPEAARNGQSRHPGRRGTARRHGAFLPLESLGVDAFTIRDLTLVSAQLFTGLSAYTYIIRGNNLRDAVAAPSPPPREERAGEGWGEEASLLTLPARVGKGLPCRASCALSILGQCIMS